MGSNHQQMSECQIIELFGGSSSRVPGKLLWGTGQGGNIRNSCSMYGIFVHVNYN